MDPNRTLENIRAIAAEIRRAPVGQVFDLADELSWMVTDLDEWLKKGGLLPDEWAKHNR